MLKPETLTVLAEGSRTVLLGDEERSIIPVTRLLYDIRYRDRVRQPRKHPLPPEDSPHFLGYKLTHDKESPAEVVLIFQYFESVGLRIYVAFEEKRRVWHLRELRSKPGSYFEEIET